MFDNVTADTIVTFLPHMYIWFLLPIIAFYVGMTKGGIGNGLGSLSIIFLTLVVDPLLALSLSLPIFFMSDVTGLVSWWGQWDKKIAMNGILWCLLGVVLGYFLLLPIQKGLISTDILKFFLGLAGIGVALRWWITTQIKKKDFVKFPIWIQNGFAVISGLASTTLSFGGIFLITYMLNFPLKSSVMHATTVAISSAINGIKLMPYSMLGLFNVQILIISIFLAPFVFFGVRFGKYIHTRMNQDLFIKVAYFGVSIASVKILYDVLL